LRQEGGAGEEVEQRTLRLDPPGAGRAQHERPETVPERSG
jgi:hypothetical protein